MIKHRYLSGLVLLLLSSLLVGCGSSAPAEAVLQIGTRTVTVDEFQHFLTLNALSFDRANVTPEKVREQLFNQLVVNEVVLNEARLKGLGIDSNFNTIPYQSADNQLTTFTSADQYALDAFARTIDLPRPSATAQVQFRYLAVINVLADPNATPDRAAAQGLLDQIRGGQDLEQVALAAQQNPAIADGQNVIIQTETVTQFVSLNDVSGVMGNEAAVAMANQPLNEIGDLVEVNVPAAADRPPLLVWLIIQVLDRTDTTAFQSWADMIGDEVGQTYLGALVNQYQVEGRMQLYPERLQSIPVPPAKP